MTPNINNRGNVISKITLGALEDIGYTVDYAQADMSMPDSIVASIDNEESNMDLSGDTTAVVTNSSDEADYYA